MKLRELTHLKQEERYLAILNLSESLNTELRRCFISTRSQGRDTLSETLLVKVEEIIAVLKSDGFKLFNIEYCGSTEYEHSEQQWGPGYAEEGLYLRFIGFTVQLSWV